MVNSKLKAKETREKLVKFIKQEIHKAGLKKAVIGLSGGIDSTLVAYLSAAALGKENVIGVLMPYETSSQESLEDAKLVARELGIETETVEITPMINAYFKKFPHADNIRRGNKMARERMSVLYDFSKEHNGMVVGTGNKTEALLGYGTIHGDMACGIAPLSGLYKTQVRELAKHMNVPPRILNKVPSADLWVGQTDEGDLGVDYETMDNILNLLIEKKQPVKSIVNKGFKLSIINKLKQKITDNEFKTRPPKVPK
ncbi:NAD+ synthase [Candidatus Margulisiibacteriota bacterium]